ncbi:MAG: glycosyltransferase family 39 protein [Chloroflexi bacterium]|nr:glycosyltransferase family 39 protein [Chloroflexota bacterium]
MGTFFSWKSRDGRPLALYAALLALAGGSIAAAFYAQSLITPNLATLARSALIYVAAAAVFAVVFRLPPLAKVEQPPKSEHVIARGVVVLIAIGLFAVSWRQASATPTGFLALFLWLASLVLFVAGVANWPRSVSLQGLKEKALPKSTWVALVPPALVLAAALAIRLYRLGDLPSFFIDEAIGGFYTLKSSMEGSLPLFTPVWEGVSNVGFGLQGFIYSWFGQSVAALRLPYALLGAVEVFFVYLLGKEIGGKKAGLVAAFLLAVLEVHVHFSRTTMFMSSSISWTGTAAFLVRGVRRGSWFDWALAGVIGGLGLNAGFPPRLLPALIALVLFGLLVLRPQPWRWLLPGVLFVAAGYVIGTGPYLAYLLAHSDQMAGRAGESWLPAALASITDPSSVKTPVNIGDLLWKNLQREALGINLFGDAHTWYREGRPMFGPLISPLLFLGVAALTLRLRDWRCLLWGIWLWSAFLLLGVGSNMTPVFHRPVPFLAMASLAIGVALAGLGFGAERLFRQRPIRWVYWLGVAVFVGFFAWQQLSDYFLNYAPRDNWPTDDLVARYLHDLGPGNDVVMLGDFDHGTQSRLVQFGIALGKKNTAVDWKDAKTPISAPQAGRSVVFVAHPSRLKDLATVKGLYPGGTEAELTALGKAWWVVYRYGP